jgi:hypothetical protein
MKKIYQNPTIKIVKIQPTNILANSLRTSEEYADPELGMSSRLDHKSIWDDEEEDDEYDY